MYEGRKIEGLPIHLEIQGGSTSSSSSSASTRPSRGYNSSSYYYGNSSPMMMSNQGPYAQTGDSYRGGRWTGGRGRGAGPGSYNSWRGRPMEFESWE
ncbi:hypothetical protein CSUI_003132 [Cystoisospora suis]|uniref:Uncharacterized protein n=1 Tax=Cystoisospora suis TaxID=483139 RepID=A0A2C6L5H2_9APIC|nr:hypothetical protein CSUI_003132 [Cystoisospora suis]